MDLELQTLKMEINIEGLLEKTNLKVMVICIIRKWNVILKVNLNKVEVKIGLDKEQIIIDVMNK